MGGSLTRWRRRFMGPSCDNWCQFHLSVTQVGESFAYVHRVTTAGVAPRNRRALACHSIRMRSVYEASARVVEQTAAADASICERRKEIPADGAAAPFHSRFFVEIRQTPSSRIETFGFAIPDGKGLSYEASSPLNPFPTDEAALAYICSYKDLIDAFGINPGLAREHYLRHGRKEGRTVTFEPLRYVASHPDLFIFGTNRAEACKHFIRHGHREARAIVFDPFAYMASYPDLLETIAPDEEKAVDHYIRSGFAEGRHCYVFPWRDYLRFNPDLVGEIEYSQCAVAEHYVRTGYKEKRRVSET
jgi:hypothetical protein